MMRVHSRTTLLFLALFLGSFGGSDAKVTLNISYITSFTGSFRASGGIPIIDKALQQINDRNDLLENYTLQYTHILDSKCSRSHAFESFFHDFKNETKPKYISLLCCGCSTATIPVAEVSHYWNVPHVSFDSAASVLDDRERFKTFFRALPSFNFLSIAYAQLMKHFKWRQMIIITQQVTLFTNVASTLQKISEEEGWTLGQIELESNLEEIPYDTVFDKINAGNYRVITLNTYGEYTVKLLCEAYHRGMKYPKYTWLMIDGLVEEWWENYVKNTTCTNEAIMKMINGSIISVVPRGVLPYTENGLPNTTSGERADSFIEMYHGLLNQTQYKDYHDNGIAGVAYDSMWSIALGLDKASKKIAAGNDSECSDLPGDLVPLEEFDYSNEKLGCILKNSIDEVSFIGVTGQFSLANRIREDKKFLVNQLRLSDDNRIRRVSIAEIYHSENRTNFTFLRGENVKTVWGSDEAPYDGSSIKTIVGKSLPLLIIYYMSGLAGLIFTAACLVFNVIYRKKKIVKLASPNLNYLILIGSALLYSDVFLYVSSVDNFNDIDAFTTICNFRFLIFSLGYTTCFAVVLSKQWRIYYIFSNPTSKKKTMKDWTLLVMIVTAVAVDVFIVTVGTAIPQSRLKAKEMPSDVPYSISDNGERQENFFLICSSDGSYIWLLISFIYKGCLQVLAIFMAFHTRKVKIKALNDSKEIMAIIYINSIILALLTVTEFALKSYNDAYAALFGLSLLIEATLFLGLVFVPKMVHLYLDPNGEKIFATTSDTYNQQKKKAQNLYSDVPAINGNLKTDNNDSATELKSKTCTEESKGELKEIKEMESKNSINEDSCNHV